MNWIFIIVLTTLLNIPFGFWRANVKKFSGQWFLAVHCPIPFIILMRLEFGIGWHLITFPVIIVAYFLGQYLGAKVNKRRRK